VAVGSAVILSWLVMDDVGFGDSGEIGTAAHVLGVAHPTGFAIDLLLLRAASLVPLGHVAFRQNLCTALVAAAALGLLAHACDLLARRIGITQRSARWLGPTLAATALLCWPTFLAAARSVEVYALALAAALLALVGAARGGAAAGLGWLVVGFAPGLHVTAGVLALLISLGVAAKAGARAAARQVAARLPVIAAGALILTYLPLASSRDPAIDWGDPEDPARMLAHLTAARIRSAFHAEMLSAESNASLEVVSQWLELWPLVPLALIAIAIGLRRKPLAVLAPLVLLSADLAYSVWIHPMGAVDRQVGHMAGASLALLGGLGTATVCAIGQRRWGARGVALAVALAAAAGAIAIARAPASELTDGYAAGELFGSGGPLAAVPPRTLVLCSTDDPCAAGLFALHVEAVRPDVEVLPAQHLWDATVLRRLRGVPDPASLLPLVPTPAQRRAAAEAVLLKLCSGAGPRPVWLQSAEPIRGLRPRIHVAAASVPPYFRAVGASERASRPTDALQRLDRMRAARLPQGLPRAARARHGWSRAYGALGEQTLAARPDIAVRALRTAVRLAPARAASWTNLGVALETTGDLRAAIDATRRAIAIEPARPTPWVNLARLTLRQSGPDAARSVLELARRARVRDPRLAALAHALPARPAQTLHE
jgi:tetratricopeptide (TPR) repeat protein